ncbi:MAG: hypothetical protein JWR80_4986 [Bradyrhizobium sp.]|nr:hypothetical protein [Bradyrhizobium sp.]
MQKIETFIPASPDLQRRWNELRTAISAAAAPHTGMMDFALPAYRVTDLPGAKAELQGAIAQQCGGKVDGPDVAGTHCHVTVRGAEIGFLITRWRRDEKAQGAAA